jgi:hypothetical protein
MLLLFHSFRRSPTKIRVEGREPQKGIDRIIINNFRVEEEEESILLWVLEKLL